MNDPRRWPRRTIFGATLHRHPSIKGPWFTLLTTLTGGGVGLGLRALTSSVRVTWGEPPWDPVDDAPAGRVLYIGWHRSALIGLIAFAGLPERVRPVYTAHDGLLSRVTHLTAPLLGYHGIIFSRRSSVPPREQLRPWFAEEPRPLVLLVDSAGPYGQVKEGSSTLARQTGRDIIPFKVEVTGGPRLTGPSGYALPLPGCTLRGSWGPRIPAADATRSACQAALDRLDALGEHR